MESGVEAGSGGVYNVFFLAPLHRTVPADSGGSVLSTLPPKLCTRPATPPQVVAASQPSSGGPADLREKIHGSVTTIGPDNRISHPPNHHPFMDIRVRKTSVWPLAP